MPNLTAREIAQHAANAGFSGNDLEIAVAVALAESSGNPGALGDISLQTNKWGASVGLWQIRSLNPGYGTSAEQATRNHDANLDPATNARHAYEIYQQRNNSFNDWSTYTEGQYRSHLNAARQGISQLGDGNTTTQPVQQDQNTTPSGGGQSNSNGFMSELQKLLEAVGKLLNPADKLNKAGQILGRASASSAAFGQVQGSSAAHQAHTANTQKYRDHAVRGQERLRTQSDEIKAGARCYEDLSGKQAESINRTTQKAREN